MAQTELSENTNAVSHSPVAWRMSEIGCPDAAPAARSRPEAEDLEPRMFGVPEQDVEDAAEIARAQPLEHERREPVTVLVPVEKLPAADGEHEPERSGGRQEDGKHPYRGPHQGTWPPATITQIK